MPVSDDVDGEPASDGTRPMLRAHETAPGRVVFVEPDNSDAWIATDDALDVEQHC